MDKRKSRIGMTLRSSSFSLFRFMILLSLFFPASLVAGRYLIESLRTAQIDKTQVVLGQTVTQIDDANDPPAPGEFTTAAPTGEAIVHAEPTRYVRPERSEERLPPAKGREPPDPLLPLVMSLEPDTAQRPKSLPDTAPSQPGSDAQPAAPETNSPAPAAPNPEFPLSNRTAPTTPTPPSGPLIIDLPPKADRLPSQSEGTKASVVLRIVVAEMNRSAALQIGINLGCSTMADGLAVVSYEEEDPACIDFEQSILMLNTASCPRSEKLQPICLYGHAARCLGGGQFPLSGRSDQRITLVLNGTATSFKPITVEPGRLKLAVSTILGQAFASTIDLCEGQTIVLTGAAPAVCEPDMDCYPRLRLPRLLGASQRSRAAEQEVVVLVTAESAPCR